MEDILSKIESILSDDRLDREESPDSKCDLIEALIETYCWWDVREAIFHIFISPYRPSDYRVAAEVLWGRRLGSLPSQCSKPYDAEQVVVDQRGLQGPPD